MAILTPTAGEHRVSTCMFGLLLSQPAVIVNHHRRATYHIFDLPEVTTLMAAAEKCENLCCRPIF
jgi:hypothetical protein